MRAEEFVKEARVTYSGLQYRGFPCTKDCGGHRAGYQWARRKGLTRRSQIPTTVHNSFYEGCLSWIMRL